MPWTCQVGSSRFCDRRVSRDCSQMAAVAAPQQLVPPGGQAGCQKRLWVGLEPASQSAGLACLQGPPRVSHILFS